MTAEFWILHNNNCILGIAYWQLCLEKCILLTSVFWVLHIGSFNLYWFRILTAELLVLHIVSCNLGIAYWQLCLENCILTAVVWVLHIGSCYHGYLGTAFWPLHVFWVLHVDSCVLSVGVLTTLFWHTEHWWLCFACRAVWAASRASHGRARRWCSGTWTATWTCGTSRRGSPGP